jgi:hypothetical protein
MASCPLCLQQDARLFPHSPNAVYALDSQPMPPSCELCPDPIPTNIEHNANKPLLLLLLLLAAAAAVATLLRCVITACLANAKLR